MWSVADKKQKLELRPNIVALKTAVKPEWIVGSKTAKNIDLKMNSERIPIELLE